MFADILFSREMLVVTGGLALLLAVWLRTRSWVRGLLRSQERFRAIFENAPDGILVVDPGSGRILDLNPLAGSWFGIERGTASRRLFGDIVQSPVEPRHTPAPPYTTSSIEGMYHVRSAALPARELSLTCAGIVFFERPALLLFARDITERKRTERELMRTDKLNALGILAGGIAHDFNNLLTAIWSGIALLRAGCADPAVQRDTINDIEGAVERGRDLTMRLLTYARGGAPVRGCTLLQELVNETSRFVLSGSSCALTLQEVVAGEGRVLVMDDDRVVRLMCTRLLERLGYRATAVEDGSAALAAFAQAGTDADPFDLVIVDLTVPGGMGGRETGAKLLQLDPHARIVVSSGYHDDEVMARYRDFGFTGVIRKPYSLSELSRVVSSALHQA